MILDKLYFWIDIEGRSASGQMATDEAAFRWTLANGSALLRFYQWDKPSVTIGYFDEYPENEKRPVIRRMTGGGMVEHGRDITFCLTLPSTSAAAQASTEDRYRWIHESLRAAITEQGIGVRFFEDHSTQKGPCFSNPVKWDLMDSDGGKLVGGAQRKSKGTVIHQGSMNIELPQNAQTMLARQIADKLGVHVQALHQPAITEIEISTKALDLNKYSTPQWCKNRKITGS